MSTDKGISLFAALLGENLDIVVPRHHRLVRLGPEYPSVAAVHGSSLATFDDKLVG